MFLSGNLQEVMSSSGSQLLQVLEGHCSDVTHCDFFGHYLATCSSDKSVRLWFFNNGNHFEEASFSPLLGHTYGVNCIRFSPFGTLLASCSTDGNVILWNVQNGEKMSELKHSSGSPVRVCSFIPSSAILATGGDDEKIVLWDISTKSAVRILEGHEAMVSALAFTPDSALLASCSTSGDVMLWDARYGHGKYLFSCSDVHDLGVLGCDFSSQYEASSGSGSLSSCYFFATCGNDDLVKLWYVQFGGQCSMTLSAVLEGHSGNVMSCRFSTDGMFLASTAGDKTVILWDTNTGQAVQKLQGHNRYVTCCAFSSSSLLATGSNDKTVRVWSLDKSKLQDSSLATDVTSACHLPNNEKFSISSWTENDVCSWLKQLKLDEYSEIFQKQAIDGKELIHLTHESLLAVLKMEALGHRNKILRGIQALKNPLWQHIIPENDDATVLEEFYCPITHEIMINPVVAADGYSYEHSAIKEWFDNGNNTSPMTNEVLDHHILIPNRILLFLIQKYKM